MSKYYKVSTQDGAVIDALENPVFVTWDNSLEIVEVCEETAINIMGVISSSSTTIWQISEKEQFPSWLNLLSVTCKEIDKLEYDAIIEDLKPDEYDIHDDAAQDQPTQERIQRLKTNKTNEMRRICSDVIMNGIDVQLSDGNTHHFSLTVEDQLNLITISSMISEGQTVLPYHADGEPCVYFTAEEMLNVIETATEFKTFHTTYFNSLKTYISALETVNGIESIYYGINIPEEYQSPVWKEINANEDT